MNPWEIISSVATALSVALTAVALIINAKTYSSTKKHNIKQSTINDYSKLQSEVLDRLVSFKPNEINSLIENKKESSDFMRAYDDCRALIARCEHFAVGVENGVYDFDVVDELGGLHLVFLFKKVYPVVKESRNSCTVSEAVPYSAFEKLVDKLNIKYNINIK